MTNALKLITVGLLSTFILYGCKKEEEEVAETTVEASGSTDISVLASKFNTGNTTFTINGSNIVITTKSQPDHKSAYYPVGHSLYESYSVSGFNQNPNEIVEQSITMTIPRYPSIASNHESTPMGTMGVAVNSVSLYNQSAAPGDVLEDEIPTFDQWDGHPQGQGNYHYHLESSWLTQENGNEGLVGLLMDGFPVYGTHENGTLITNADLDEYHGHFSVTPDFPAGIYHYHVTGESPYINGNGFYGIAGTITH